jgi:hypothetical protein
MAYQCLLKNLLGRVVHVLKRKSGMIMICGIWLCMVSEVVMSSETGIYTKFRNNFLVQIIELSLWDDYFARILSSPCCKLKSIRHHIPPSYQM